MEILKLIMIDMDKEIVMNKYKLIALSLGKVVQEKILFSNGWYLTSLIQKGL